MSYTRLKNFVATFEILVYSHIGYFPWLSMLWAALKYITGSNFLYRNARWGYFGHIASLFGMFNTNSIRRLHWNINTWKDEEVLAWKESYMAACTAIQVAGAIFSSVGLTALQLPNMDSTHWSARALLSCSMILGILSVVFAAARQQDISMLHNALGIRLWLSRGRMEPTKTDYGPPFNLLPLESSVPALKQFYLPKFLLSLSVWLYAIGFGIFLLYAWIDRVEQTGGRNDFRNIFIAFVTTVGLVCMYTFILFLWSLVDATKCMGDFELNNVESFAKPTSRRQLEEWIDALKQMQEINIEFDEGNKYTKLETTVNDLKEKWEEERKARKMREAEQRNDRKEKREHAHAHDSNQSGDMHSRLGNRVHTDPEAGSSLPKEVSSVLHAPTWS